MKTIFAWLVAWSLGLVAVGQTYYDLTNVVRYPTTNIIFAAIDFDGGRAIFFL